MFHEESDQMNEWQKKFFEVQFSNANKSPTARRYHPDIIRWALELYSRSPSAYQQLRTSGVLTLPSSKTLQNYRFGYDTMIVIFTLTDMIVSFTLILSQKCWRC